MPEADDRAFTESPAEEDDATIAQVWEVDQTMVETLDLDALVVEMIDSRRQRGCQGWDARLGLAAVRGVPVETHGGSEPFQRGESNVERHFARAQLHEQRHYLRQERVGFHDREEMRSGARVARISGTAPAHS